MKYILIKRFTTYTLHLWNLTFVTMFQSREDKTAIVGRHCSCYGLSLATDDFELAFLPLHSVLKILPGKDQFSITFWNKGKWGLGTLPFSKCQNSALLSGISFLFSSHFFYFFFHFTDCKVLMQSLGKCIKTQGADHTPLVSSINKNLYMAKFLGLMDSNR